MNEQRITLPYEHESMVFAERLSNRAIKEIVVNPAAFTNMPEQFHYMLDKRWFKHHALMNTRKEFYDVAISTPTAWTRALAINSNQIPFGNYVGGTTIIKGTSWSGGDFENPTRHKTDNVPWGFFGRYEAEKDMYTSNILLEEGARVALPLGYIVLDHDITRNWLKERTNRNPYQHNLLRNFDIVRDNDDDPVLYFREAGSKDRLDGLVYGNKITKARYRYESARMAQNFLLESSLYPESFNKFLKYSGESVLDILEKMAKGEDLVGDDFFLYTDFLCAIHSENIIAIKNVYKKRNFEYSNLGSVLAASKDICLGHFSQDFEELKDSEDEDIDILIQDNVDTYKSRISSLLKSYMTKKVKYYVENNAEEISKITNNIINEYF